MSRAEHNRGGQKCTPCLKTIGLTISDGSYCKASIDKFLSKGNTVMAVKFAERSRSLQVYTAMAMMDSAMFDEAMEMRARFGLQAEVRY